MDDLSDVRHRVTACFAFSDRLREALDRGERGPQLVRDVREEGLLASPSTLDLARHLVEGGTHLRDLARTGDRHACPVVPAGEAANAADEVPQGSRDRARQETRHDQGEPQGYESGDRQRWQQRTQRIREHRTWTRDHDEAETAGAHRGLPELLTDEDPLLVAVGGLTDVRRRRLRNR